MSVAAGSASNGPGITIIIDDDSDIQISSRDLFLPDHLLTRPTFHEFIAIEDLELRLGPSAPSTPRELPTNDQQTTRARSEPVTIDLTSSLSSRAHQTPPQSKKRKKRTRMLSEDSLSSDSEREVKLKCSICMGSMKEETSTICGHIFCKRCILGAIQAQKTCPACRKKLTSNDIHRIYISG